MTSLPQIEFRIGTIGTRKNSENPFSTFLRRDSIYPISFLKPSVDSFLSASSKARWWRSPFPSPSPDQQRMQFMGWKIASYPDQPNDDDERSFEQWIVVVVVVPAKRNCIVCQSCEIAPHATSSIARKIQPTILNHFRGERVASQDGTGGGGGNKFFTPSELIYFPHASFPTMIYLCPLDVCFFLLLRSNDWQHCAIAAVIFA